MRAEKIKVSFLIPLPINEPDKNGVIYTEHALRSACQNSSGTPITIFNQEGVSAIVGFATECKYEDGNLIVDGLLFNGGTSELVELTAGAVTSMDIVSIGITT